jgi:hypothetical protein
MLKSARGLSVARLRVLIKVAEIARQLPLNDLPDFSALRDPEVGLRKI